MISGWMRAVGLLALAPATALAFETVDMLPWPSLGRFPAYAADPVRPWTVWAYAGAMYDSNVLRLDGNEQSDTITRVGLGGSYGARVIGRQSVLLEGFGEYRTYNTFDQLNHFAYGLRGEWLWELGNELSGVLGARRLHRLADLAEVRTPVKDMLTEDRVYATGGYRFAADWRLTGGIGSTRVEHDGRPIDTAYSYGASVGIAHVSPLGNTIGVEYRHAQGDSPVDEELGIGAFPDNEFDEDEVALTLVYGLGPTLRVRGRLGYTWRGYTELPDRDFNGTTGHGTIEWQPGAKTLLVFEAYREADPIIDIDALHVDRRGVAFGASWAVLLKLVLSARFVREHRLYQGDPTIDVLGTPERDETLRLWRFGIGWEPARHWQIGLGFDIGERRSNELGRDYDYKQVMLNGRFIF